MTVQYSYAIPINQIIIKGIQRTEALWNDPLSIFHVALISFMKTLLDRKQRRESRQAACYHNVTKCISWKTYISAENRSMLMIRHKIYWKQNVKKFLRWFGWCRRPKSHLPKPNPASAHKGKIHWTCRIHIDFRYLLVYNRGHVTTFKI